MTATETKRNAEKSSGEPDMVARLTGIKRTYQKHKAAPPVHALKGIDLEIPRGEYLAIMGPSGSGKSSLMNILGCLDQPTAGEYELDGQNVARMTDRRLSVVRGQMIGFVFQAFNLIPQDTILTNVQVPLFYQGVPKGKRLKMATEALEKVGLGDRLSHRPGQLSGGQMQRVAIARALVNNPSLLMADEPTGNLDSATGEAILQMFEELHSKGLTIIMVTHDESVSTRCERVVRLRDGLIDSDTHN